MSVKTSKVGYATVDARSVEPRGEQSCYRLYPSEWTEFSQLTEVEQGHHPACVEEAASEVKASLQLPDFAVCNVHCFAQILEGKIRMRIVDGYNDYP